MSRASQELNGRKWYQFINLTNVHKEKCMIFKLSCQNQNEKRVYKLFLHRAWSPSITLHSQIWPLLGYQATLQALTTTGPSTNFADAFLKVNVSITLEMLLNPSSRCSWRKGMQQLIYNTANTAIRNAQHVFSSERNYVSIRRWHSDSVQEHACLK